MGVSYCMALWSRCGVGVSNPGYGEYTIYGKTSASVLILGFRYFELRNIYKQISNCIRIPIFSSKFVHR